MIAATLAVALLVLASLAGIALSIRFSWTAAARDSRQDIAAGLGLAPFIAGLAAVIVLWALPGRAAAMHLGVIFGLLGTGAATLLLRRLPMTRSVFAPGMTAILVVCGLVAAILLQLVYAPLTQNDALEYATVGRILYEARTLAAYPAIDPLASSSGFFGPWTHPPLYVAQIYLADLLQGGTESPRLMRFIAPWHLISAALCVGTMAMSVGRLATAAAIGLFLGLPVLLLGAIGALIDPLPVAGFTLALIAALNLDGKFGRGLGLGIVMGVALWTHSEAVLFPFLIAPLLLLVPGTGVIAGSRAAILDALRTVAVAVPPMVAIGAAPYIRNLSLFGSPISDTPAVFGFVPLGFADYFQLQRGFDSAVDLIQYGVLKGFFAIDSYSLTFWIAVFAAPLAWRAIRRCVSSQVEAPTQAERIVAACAIVIAAYFAIVVVTVILGVDLMVRNDRYLAVVMPCVALLGAAALRQNPLGALRSRGTRTTWLALRVVLVHGLLGLTMAQCLLAYIRQNAWRPGVEAFDDASQFAGSAQFSPIAALRTHVPRDGVVLTMRPADLYYGDRRMVSYLDPRMIPFYSETSPASALSHLRGLGITHVHVPDYYLPPVYNSPLMAILADPAQASLRLDNNGYQLYELHPRAAVPGAPAAPLVSEGAWSVERSAVLGGPRSRLRVSLGSRPYAPHQMSRNSGFLGAFHHEIAHQIFAPVTGLSPLQCPDRAGLELFVHAEVRGRAHLLMFARMRDAAGVEVQTTSLADRSLVTPDASRPLTRRMLLPETARTVQIGFFYRGGSIAAVDSLTLDLNCGTH